MHFPRRRAIGLGLAGTVGLAVAGCSWRMFGPMDTVSSAPSVEGPFSLSLGGGVRLHLIETGHVAVKQAHRRFDGPDALRLPAILADSDWTEWLPVTCFAVEHPEGLFVVDTGETVRILEQRDYTACDPVTGFFYRRNLRFSLTREDEFAAQMGRLGLSPERIDTVVLTHMHSDHVGGLPAFAGKRTLVSSEAAGGHAGALLCRVRESVTPEAVDLSESALDAFPRSLPLTSDGALSLVATPGHATGHMSVLLRAGGRKILLAGDAAFSRDQIAAQEMAGIVEHPASARDTLRRLKAQADDFGTLILPAHDAGNRAALAGLAG